MAILFLILWAIIHYFWKPFGSSQTWLCGMLMFWTGVIVATIESHFVHKKVISRIASIFNQHATIVRSKFEELHEHRITEYLNKRFAELRATPNSKRELVGGILSELDDLLEYHKIESNDKSAAMIRSKAFELYAKLDEDLII